MQNVLGLLTAKAERLLATMPLLLLALIVLVAAWAVGRWISRRSVLDRVARHNPFLQDLVRTTVRWAVLIAGIVLALEIVGATKLVGAVLGTAGVLGVALGFAFRDILENYLAGVLMSLRQPFAPRDHVVIDGNEGIVVALTSRATILMTLDGNHLRLPNALVFRSVTLNYTRNPRRRFEFDVGVGDGEDLLAAQQIGIAELRTLEGVLVEPPARAQVRELGDSTVQVRFQAWVDQRSHDFRLVRSEGIRRVKEALDAAGVELPAPTYRLQWPQGAAAPAPASSSGPAMQKPRPAPARDGVDTRATEDLLAQVETERGSRDDDLLNSQAPRE